MFNYHSFFTDNILPVLGFLFFLINLIPIVIQIIITIIFGKLFDISSTFLYNYKQQIKQTTAYFNKFSKSYIDGDIVLWTIWLGIMIPLFSFKIALQKQSYWLLLIYNIIRIGPMYANFAHTYTLCHMEAHRYHYLFKVGKSNPIRYIYNFWIGLFFGVLPGTFTESHLKNHHYHNNNIYDIHSTAGYRRDSFKSFFRYLIVWFAYASNISSIWYFWKNKDHTAMINSIIGTVYYILFIWSTACMFGNVNCFFIYIYPFIEGNLLLSLVNYTWHLFLSEDETNDYVNSTTIENGKNFIFSEEYHVVHHTNPGYHHSRYTEEFKKNEDKYDIIFQNVNIFELGITAIFGNYERLYEMTKPSTISKDEVIAKLKKRVRQTWW